LVALVHVPNPKNLPTVNHQDGNKQNNDASNLVWASHADQLLHAYRAGLRTAQGNANGKAKLTDSAVLEIRRLAQTCVNRGEIAAKFGIHRSTVGQIIRGELWSHLS
jgi:hypothetical protein